MIGLAALAALALMASLGASSASAAETTLCKSAASSPFCPSSERYAAKTALKASTSAATIETSAGNVVCESTLEGEISAASGTPQPISISAWPMSGCHLGAQPCTVTTEGAPYAASLSWTASDDGDLNVKNGGSGAPKLKTKCGYIIDCTFTLEPTLTMEGGNPAAIVASKESVVKEGSICPSTAVFSATYSVSSPNPAYVAKFESPLPGTQLCKTSVEDPCFESFYYQGTAIEAEASSVTIATSSGTITCSKGSVIKGKTGASGGSPLPIELSEFSLKGCNWAGIGLCETATTQLKPASVSRTEGTLNGIWKGGASWLFKCGFNVECTFILPQSDELTLTGGNPATLVASEEFLEQSGNWCPYIAKFSANYTVTSPKPVYVTSL